MIAPESSVPTKGRYEHPDPEESEENFLNETL